MKRSSSQSESVSFSLCLAPWLLPSALQSQSSMVTMATHSEGYAEGSKERALDAARADRALIRLEKRAGLGAWARGKGAGLAPGEWQAVVWVV